MEYSFFSSIAFSCCSLFFVILIFIMYNSKQKFKNIENTLFISLLIGATALIFIEFLYVYCLYRLQQFNNPPGWFTYFSCKLYLVGIITWMYTFIFYILVQITRKYTDVEVKKAHRKRIFIALCVVTAISIGICIALPVTLNYGQNELLTFDGPATDIGYFVGGTLILVIIYWLITTNKGMVSDQKKPLIVAISFVIGLILLQFFVEEADYNIQNFQFVSILAALFFTLESQDNKLLTEREKSKEEAEALNKSQTEFLTSMSHEIRTPMSTILGYSESLLRDKDLTEETVKHDTKFIHIAAVSLLDLINNILDLSRIDSEKEQVVEQDFALKDTLLEVYENINSKLENKNVKLEVKLNEELPSKYLGDAPKINKIVLNVVGYLINKPEISNVTLNITEHKDETNDFTFLCSIEGSSDSFECDYQKLIDEFNNLKDNEVDNLTLGLIVAKRYITMLGGKSEISCTEDFIKYDMIIPSQVTDSTPIGNIFKELENIQNAKLDLSGKKILVVDDNIINIKLINRLLNDYNPELDSCTSGLECIDKVQETKYDIIFLDHMMPGLDGVETLAKMKDLVSNLPPVIALTANSYSGAREKYLEDGFYDYLAKPFNVNELKNLLIKVFKK